MSIRVFYPACFLAALFLGTTALAQSEPSLAEVVRAHKPVKKAARIYTNDDIPSRPPEVAPAPAPPDPKVKELKDLEEREGKLKQDWNDLQEQIQSESDPAKKEELIQKQAALEHDLLLASNQIAQLKKSSTPKKEGDQTQPKEQPHPPKEEAQAAKEPR